VLERSFLDNSHKTGGLGSDTKGGAEKIVFSRVGGKAMHKEGAPAGSPLFGGSWFVKGLTQIHQKVRDTAEFSWG